MAKRHKITIETEDDLVIERLLEIISSDMLVTTIGLSKEVYATAIFSENKSTVNERVEIYKIDDDE